MTTCAMPAGYAFPPYFEATLSRRQRGILGAAVLASLLLHAAALGWFPDFRATPGPIAEPLRVQIAAPAIEPPPVAVPPAPTFRQDSTAGQRPVSKPVAAPVLTRAPETTNPTTPGVAMPLAPDEPSPLPREAVVQTPPVQRAVVDPAALAAYGRSVTGAVAAHQKYPRAAILRQLQGTTLLQLELAADGQLRNVRVLSSSGHEILDRQAIDMVRAATPLPPLPDAVASPSLTVDVPVVFRLSS